MKPHENQDLNLAFSAAAVQEYHGVPQFLQVPKIENNNINNNNIQLNLNSSFSSSCSSTSTSLTAMELIKSTGINASRGLNNSFHIPTPMPADHPNMMYTSGFPFQEFKPVVGFSVDGLGSARYDEKGLHGNINQENNGAAAGSRLVFPFGAMPKQIPSTNEAEQNKGHGNPTFFWNGMSGGGSW